MWSENSILSKIRLRIAVSKLAYGLTTVLLGLAMAGGTAAFLPKLLFFPAFQKFSVKGITVSALRG